MATNDFKAEIAGRFRNNPDASDHNNIRTVDLATPGTPATDSLVIDTTTFSGGEVISGINFTGKDGVARDILFRKQQYPDGQAFNHTVVLPALTASFDPSDLRWAIHNAVQIDETDPILKVAYDDAGDEITITHIGSGTLNKLIIDNAPVGTNTRTGF